MSRRALPGVVWPLSQPQWRALVADDSGWALLPRVVGPDPLPVERVDVVWEWGRCIGLRLSLPFPAGHRATRRRHQFLWLRAAHQPRAWALLRAHLARTRRGHWLGAQ